MSGLFNESFFRFYEELKVNNERAWFQDNKKRYEKDVVAPMLSFIEAMGPRLSVISSRFRADPRKSGGSLFRIYRDTRFSKDKTPYKTHAAAHFRHELAKDVHAPGFYFHVDTESLFIASGIWQPGSEALNAIREAIAENPETWMKIQKDAAAAGFAPHGDSLKRPPRGFDKDHPAIEEIKRKDFILTKSYPAETLLREDLADLVIADFAETKQMVSFLCRAMDVPF